MTPEENYYSRFGFVWGPMRVERLAHLEGRGRVISVKAGSKELQVYVSEKGRRVRVFEVGGEEWKP